MYYAIGVSVPSLHRESTDSLILTRKLRLVTFYTKLGPEGLQDSDIIGLLHAYAVKY